MHRRLLAIAALACAVTLGGAALATDDLHDPDAVTAPGEVNDPIYPTDPATPDATPITPVPVWPTPTPEIEGVIELPNTGTGASQ